MGAMPGSESRAAAAVRSVSGFGIAVAAAFFAPAFAPGRFRLDENPSVGLMAPDRAGSDSEGKGEGPDPQEDGRRIPKNRCVHA
jgi:hypothetical protein